MVSESFAALLPSEPNSLLVILGSFPGVSHCGNSVWPEPSTHCSQTAPGKAAGRGCWLSLRAGALPSLLGHPWDTHVGLMWLCPRASQWPLGRLRWSMALKLLFPPWVFATGARMFEVVWFSLVPQGPGLPNKCWRLKQVLNYQLLLNFGTSAIISSRQRKLWSEFSVFSSFLCEGVLPYMEVSQF